MPKSKTTADSAPHSWDLEHWPQNVYPHSESRARWLLRSHRDELLAAGALTRVGRELVVLGARYTRWLEGRAVEVPGFACAANKGRGRAQDVQAA